MKKIAIVAAAAAVMAVGTSAHATVNFIKNGSFELDSYVDPKTGKDIAHEFGASFAGPGKPGNSVTDWTSPSKPAFNVWEPDAKTATSVNAFDRFNPAKGQFLWQLPGTPDPDGGAFVILDGDPKANGPLQQSVSGLTVGKTYTLSFDWAAVQYASRTGATTDKVQVSFGSDVFSTPIVADPSKGAQGWFTVSHAFTAKSTSELLSFLSIGTPVGLPPAVALDGVSLKANVPEPATWAMMILGFFGLGGALRARRRDAVA